MSQENGQTELREKTRQLLKGPLKHVRVAALAAALLPLASVVAAPASAQALCPSGGVCGTVFNDTNNNGVQDAGETGIEGIAVTVCQLCNGTDNVVVYTDVNGFYTLSVPSGTYTVFILIPAGTQVSPVSVGGNAGISNGLGYSVALVTATFDTAATDFGFFTAPVQQPGTGTPGYWKNHPEAWPVSSITVGGITYTEAEAIAWLSKPGKDKTTTMFGSLVPAMLNVLIGNDGSCVNSTIAAGNAWMATYGPVGSNVAASSYAWTIGEPLQSQMDSYNNGQLCAPHRQ
jgi:hypothetical protein